MDATIRTYSIAWFGLMVIAMLNGMIRDLGYGTMVGDPAGHQISTVALLVFFSLFLTHLMKRWPIGSMNQAWIIGGIWFGLTILFETTMGLARGRSWAEMLQAYDITSGRLWVLVPAWTFLAPPVFQWDSTHSSQRP